MIGRDVCLAIALAKPGDGEFAGFDHSKINL
jgi:hypothetical protein